MSVSALTLTLVCMGASLAQVEGTRLEGAVVNGTQKDAPVAGADVLLRAGEDGALHVVAKTVTDSAGRFVFDKLPVDPGLIFLPGANYHGVHYPGTRIRLSGATPRPPVILTVYEAVTVPSPLVIDRREIDIRVQDGVLEVTETLQIDNPSLTTYVGPAESGSFAKTLALSIPDGFDRVTFAREFNGRRFKLKDGQLVTDIAWTPGTREVTFTYHLPLEDGKRALVWSTDVPCSGYRIRVRGMNAERFEGNLNKFAGTNQADVTFESNELSPPGHTIRLTLGSVPTPWIVYARWLAAPILVGLIFATAGRRWFRRTFAKLLSRRQPQSTASLQPTPKAA